MRPTSYLTIRPEALLRTLPAEPRRPLYQRPRWGGLGEQRGPQLPPTSALGTHSPLPRHPPTPGRSFPLECGEEGVSNHRVLSPPPSLSFPFLSFFFFFFFNKTNLKQKLKREIGQVTSGCPSLLHAASHSSQPEFCLSGCLSSECPPTFCCHQSPKPPSSGGRRGSSGSGVWPQTRECTLKGRATRGGLPQP